MFDLLILVLLCILGFCFGQYLNGVLQRHLERKENERAAKMREIMEEEDNNAH